MPHLGVIRMRFYEAKRIPPHRVEPTTWLPPRRIHLHPRAHVEDASLDVSVERGRLHGPFGPARGHFQPQDVWSSHALAESAADAEPVSNDIVKAMWRVHRILRAATGRCSLLRW